MKHALTLVALLFFPLMACDSGIGFQGDSGDDCSMIRKTSTTPIELFGDYLDLKITGTDAYLLTSENDHIDVTPSVENPDVVRIANYDPETGVLRLEPIQNGTSRLLLDAKTECGEEERIPALIEVTSFLGCVGSCVDMWPLAVGNRWEYYRVVQSGGAGSPTTTTTQDVIVEVTGKRVEGSDTVYTVQTNSQTRKRLDGTITEDRYGRLSVNNVAFFPIAPDFLIDRYQPEGGDSLQVDVTEAPANYRFEYVLKQNMGLQRTEHQGPYGVLAFQQHTRMTLTNFHIVPN